ncbi:helix-turn-helix domain-containing protein [Agrobacterium sp. P15N1-A]|uniref:helix-turn-helix domain-containing protein n=1 Tax=Agrobacterium TaxID=357 RepID=UPI0037D49AD5
MTPDELINLRKTLGLTQSDLAGRLGLTVRGYQKLEAGESAIKEIYAKTLSMIARRGGSPFVPSAGPGGYAVAAFMIARANIYAMLEAKLMTGEQAVNSLEAFIDDLPDGTEGGEARGLMQAVINSIAHQYCK